MPVRITKSKFSKSMALVTKADTKVVVNQSLHLEDEFGSMYDQQRNNAAIEPPFNPLTLKALCTRNNILMQCIHAMETNIDGTGYEIVDDSNEGKAKMMDPRMQQALQGAKTAPTPGQAAFGLPGATDPAKLAQGMQAASAGAMPAGAPGTMPPKFGPITTAAAAAASVEAAKGGNVVPIKPGDKTKLPVAPGIDPTMLDPNADTPEEEAEKKMLEAFFKEPFPNESFLSIRRKLRADIEQTGNGYMEVIRNLNGKVTFLRHLDCTTMRLVRLDKMIPVEREIDRDGEKVSATIYVRERRYVQRVGTNYIYFKEFGSERFLNRHNGEWVDPKTDDTGLPSAGAASPPNLPTPVMDTAIAIKAERKAAKQAARRNSAVQNSFGGSKPPEPASEVLHFICDKDPSTAYGIPRWINNMPAVLGSRKAEEFNLEFFDAGGLPPAIIFIQGGALATNVRDELLAYLAGGTANKHRAAVVEAQSSSGSLDSTSSVKVTVERFGDSRQNDSMFQNYDLKCEDHVRGAFRLPAIFLGKSTDYNFATALTAVMVTEAQVFAPERREFDETINHTIVRALEAKKYRIKSLPITLKNADLQLQVLTLAAPKIDGKDMVDAANQISGLSLNYSQAAEEAGNALNMAKAAALSAGGGQGGGASGGGAPSKGGSGGPGLGAPAGKGGLSSIVSKSDLNANDIVLLAGEWANALGLADGPHLDPEERRAIVQKVESLTRDQHTLFHNVIAGSTFTRSAFDPEGLAELAGCCTDMMANG